jgi:hypothetical protein
MDEQLILPFGYRFAEDRATLLIAIGAAKLRRLDRAFVLMVHDVTHDGWLHKSYQEIGEKLNVSYSTARRCVARCFEAGLIVVQEERYRSGGQRDNAYSIDWDGVRAACFNTPPREGPAAQGEQAPAQTEHPHAHPEQGPAQTEHPYKECIPPSDPPKNPPPPKRKPGGGGGSVDWVGIKSRLESLGMLDSVGAIEAARESQLEPQDVCVLIDQWESSQPAWSLGGLYWRLSRGNWPARASPTIEQDVAAQEKARTRRLLAQVGKRPAIDPEEPSLAEQFRHSRQEVTT